MFLTGQLFGNRANSLNVQEKNQYGDDTHMDTRKGNTPNAKETRETFTQDNQVVKN